MKSLKVNDIPCLFPLDVFRAAVAPLKGDFPYEEMEFAMHSTQNTLPLCLWENMFSVPLFFFWYDWFKEKQSQNLRFSLSIWLVLVCSISVYFSINLSTVTPQSYCQSCCRQKVRVKRYFLQKRIDLVSACLPVPSFLLCKWLRLWSNSWI